MRSKAERAALYRRRARSLERLAKTTAGDAITEGMLLRLAADYENLARTLEDSAIYVAPSPATNSTSRSGDNGRLG